MILKITNRATRLITWLRSKTLVLGLLRETRAEHGLSALAVLRAVITRWTAHYVSFRRLLELKASLQTVISADEMQPDAAKKLVVTGNAKAKRKARRMVRIVQDSLFWHGILRYAVFIARSSIN